MASERRALLIATDTYSDPLFSELPGACADVETLADVLADSSIGGYSVQILRNKAAHEVTSAIEGLFVETGRNDLILLYAAGHGVKNDAGQLYLPMANSRRDRLQASTVSAQFVRDQMTRSRSRHIAVWLDCCYAGAFPPGAIPRAATQIMDVLPQLNGRGRAVMTASSAMEYAFETGAEPNLTSTDTRTAGRGVFTNTLIQGLKTGNADLDGDGLIDVDELYRYVCGQMDATPFQQTPQLDSQVEGKLYIATSVRGPQNTSGLPQEIAQALRNPLAKVRLVVLDDVVALTNSGDPTALTLVRATLADLATDENNDVAAAARTHLHRLDNPDPVLDRSDHSATTVSDTVSPQPPKVPEPFMVAAQPTDSEGSLGVDESAVVVTSQVVADPTPAEPDATLGRPGVPHTGGAVAVDGYLVEPQADLQPAESASSEPAWYQHAVFYEVLVQAFSDSNNDGTGDLLGLVEKLDYLDYLGIDCLLLGPVYASPLRDGGYDVSDFRAVLPELGNVADFVLLLDQAHRRGIRVITDLVLNHTSDTHPWFQESRNHPDGPYGDYYVWAATDTGYPNVRVILDTETSNWTYDPVRSQFFWHRFFSHEPDLNYGNPAVQEAMLDVIRFWLDLGIDGFRLDAVPYLFEEEGTNCENLPRTHEFLKQCRKIVDDEYSCRVLLAEANQWPYDVLEYFGDPVVGGDECHMALHFSLMPRIFMAVRRESRFPISEILAQTPAIPSGCQWGVFLRNRDELSLEMVTDEERDYMYAEYAKDPRMKAKIGIRRRLAPILDNDRNQLELLTALLLSLPGSPVLYYGDEIGMGDNISLNDRDGVRTPMQWTPDSNAGFSRVDPTQLYLPIIPGSVFGCQSVNVEAQTNSTSSLLNWTRRMLLVRREHPAFGLGEFTELGSSNPSVLAYLRRWVHAGGEQEVIFCVNNLSRFPQPVELDLSEYDWCVPTELIGGVRFPLIGELPYPLALPGHGFYWFQIIALGE